MRKNSFIVHGWKNYLNLPRRLRNAIYLLFVIILVEIGALFYFRFSPQPTSPEETTKFEKQVEEFFSTGIDSLSKTNTLLDENKSMNNGKKFKSGELFPFNPNNLPDEDWKRLGLSDKQIHVIRNYESKGGRFKSKADVKKMYCISDEEYALLESYIVFPPAQQADSSNKNSYKKYERKPLMVDIGIADTLELVKLPAIGPAFARRIYNYRDKLGGFYSINQLKEVWGLTDSIFQIIAPHIILRDSTNIRKINVNTADYMQFNSHPYIDKSQASYILSYRKSHGGFHSIDEIKHAALLNEELYSKLAPYLKIE
jgi:competence protein ComEA